MVKFYRMNATSKSAADCLFNIEEIKNFPYGMLKKAGE